MSLKAKVLYLASMAAFLRPFAHVIYVPSQVAMRQELGTTTSMMGLSLSVYAFVFAVSQILYGPIVDRFDGRRVLLFGMGLFAISSFGLYFASGVEVLLLLRGAQGLGIAAAVIVGLALISDVIPQVSAGAPWGSLKSLAPAALRLAQSSARRFRLCSSGVWTSSFWR